MIRTATGLAAVAGLAVALSACAGEMPFGPEPEPVYQLPRPYVPE